MPRPRPLLFEVRHSKPNGANSWRIVGFVDGKRKQYWFKTEKAARDVAADKNADILAYGTRVTLDSAGRLEACRAIERLRPHGKTITDAVDFYLAHLDRHRTSIPFSKLSKVMREEFARRVAANEVSIRHAESLNETLKKMEAAFGDSLVSEIKAEDVRSWLLSLPLAPKTRNKHRGYASQVFSFALDRGFAVANPVSRLKKFRERKTEENGKIHVLSAADTERLFRAADPEIVPFLTLSYFCGIRRATLERLDWSDVKLEEKRVIVPGYKGKNQKRYRVTLAANALEWLRPYEKPSGTILAISDGMNSRGRPSRDRTHRLIKEAGRRAGIEIPDNAGRHTFISMHVAQYESIDKTALEADNSPAVIKSNYLDIVTREEAGRYWAIRPVR